MAGWGMMDGKGKVALITGGSRGIGLGIASALAAQGMAVGITGRDERSLDTARKKLGTDAIALRADVQNERDAAKAIEDTVAQFGGLDVLVNNAGVGAFAPIADMTPSSWRQVMQTSLDGVFYCCHAAIPHLRRRGGGWIINISSLASTNPSKGSAAYCASKAGLNAFTDALMQEVRYDNIRVSAVLPGSVSTGFAFRGSGGEADWKIAPEHIAGVVLGLITFPSRSLPSRVDVRPARPGR
jgi:NAD(P)-dependent dehydrogenase (short-subunit alcohol dehydrogenase family)